MDKTITSKLQDLGLSEKESLLYLTLLTLEETSVQSIARAAKLERSTVYLLLSALEQKGFAQAIEGNPIRYVACAPTELTKTADLAVKKAEEAYEAIREAASELEDVVTQSSNTPRATYFDTPKGISTLRDEITSKSLKEPVCGLLHTQKSLDCISTRKDHRVVVSVDKIPAKPNFQYAVRFVTQKEYPVDSDLFLFSNLIILISDTEAFGVRIESTDFATVTSEAFRLAWEEACLRDGNAQTTSKRWGVPQ